MGTAKTFILLAAMTAIFMAIGFLVGGTGGMIPTRDMHKLLDYARKKRLPLEPVDFFGVSAA